MGLGNVVFAEPNPSVDNLLNFLLEFLCPLFSLSLFLLPITGIYGALPVVHFIIRFRYDLDGL